MQNTDMCLPTRLALMQYLSMRDKSQTTYPKYIPYYSNIGDEQYADVVYQNDNLEIKKVDLGYDYCYYSPTKNHRFSLMIAFDVEGEKYYAFEKINPQSQQQQDVYTFPHIDFDPDSNCALKTSLAVKILQNYGLATRLSGFETIAPYDAVSPGFCDLRQCVCRATIKMSKQDFESLATKQNLAIFSQEQLQTQQINTDYISSLAVDLDARLDFNKQMQNATFMQKDDQSEIV